MGLGKDDAYFDTLSAESRRQARPALAPGCARSASTCCRRRGSYFVTADFAPLGFAGDDVAFCRHITEHAGVAAIPVSAFYDGDAPTH